MGMNPETVRWVLSDGGMMSVQKQNGSFLVTLPKKAALGHGVTKGTDLPVVPSDRDGVLFEILEPEGRHE